MKTKHYLATLLGSAVMMAAPAAVATSFENTSFDETVSAAQLSVIGEVENIRYERRNGQIVTITSYRVQAKGFGRSAGVIDVVTPGGRMNTGRFAVAEVVAGSPRTILGQKSLLLLTLGDRAGEYTPVGWSAGVIPVQTIGQNAGQVMMPSEVGGPSSVGDAIRTIRGLRRNVRLDTDTLAIKP